MFLIIRFFRLFLWPGILLFVYALLVWWKFAPAVYPLETLLLISLICFGTGSYFKIRNEDEEITILDLLRLSAILSVFGTIWILYLVASGYRPRHNPIPIFLVTVNGLAYGFAMWQSRKVTQRLAYCTFLGLGLILFFIYVDYYDYPLGIASANADYLLAASIGLFAVALIAWIVNRIRYGDGLNDFMGRAGASPFGSDSDFG